MGGGGVAGSIFKFLTSSSCLQDESFWEKIGTLGRKKKAQEVKEVETEGKYAIDSPGKVWFGRVRFPPSRRRTLFRFLFY